MVDIIVLFVAVVNVGKLFVLFYLQDHTLIKWFFRSVLPEYQLKKSIL